MKKTFFENIGLVDLEKIHSSMIKWIFDIDIECLKLEGKNKLLSSILNKDIGVIKETYTEFDNIDVIIKTTQFVICIENKLKSFQHSDQLLKYIESINRNAEFENLTPIFIYLTLINEPSEDSDWINVSYAEIYEKLLKFKPLENKEGFILTDYIQTLSNLIGIVDDFIRNPTDYPNVFTDGHKTKSEKLKNIHYNEKQKYISRNQLETIFQKMFYRKVAEYLHINNYYTTETHGNAAIGIPIKREFYSDLNISFDFQKGTFKTFCTHKDYWHSKPSQIPDEIKRLFQQVRDKPKYGYNKVNKGKSKAQYSITKKMQEDITTLDIAKFAAIFQRELNLSIELVENEILNNL